MGGDFRYTKEQLQWIEDKMKEMKEKVGHLGVKVIKDLGLVAEFKKKFNHTITPGRIQAALGAAKRKVYGASSGKARGGAVYQKSNFLLIVADKTAGFNTWPEVMDFIKTNVIMLKDIILFEKKEIKVDYNITKK